MKAFVLFLFVITASASQTSLEKPPLVLTLGEQRLLKIPDLQKFSIGGPQIRAMPLPGASRDSEAILLKGVSLGRTDLWVWKQDHQLEHRTVHVEKWQGTSPMDFEKALQTLTEIEIIASGTHAVLRGQVQSFEELIRIGTLTRSFPEQVTDETTLNPALLDEGERKITEWLAHTPSASGLSLERQPTQLILRGEIQNPEERQKIENHARTLFPRIQFELTSFPTAAQTIHFQVYLLEVSKNQLSSFGLGWPAQTDVFQISSSKIKDTAELNLTLHSLASSGNARILSHPQIVMRAPGEAELFSGGEIPIQSTGKYFSNVTWKPHGLTLKLKASDSTSKSVRLDILTEFSQLEGVQGTQQLPGLHSNRMKTQVDATFETPLFLCGLLQDRFREEVTGLPVLKDLPVLGSLFGSRNYQEHQSELVAVLIPSVQMPAIGPRKIPSTLPMGPIPLPRKWLSAEELHRLQKSEDYPWNVLR